MNELRLKPHEVRQFTLDGSHMRKYVLQLDQKLPTCLHSWGSPADPCPCTCRLEPFSDALIRSKGIYAVVVPIMPNTGDPKYRHLHPVELAILNGLVPPEVWTSPQRPDLRLCLCGVGQLASPLQALWIGACVRRQLLVRFGLPVDPSSPVDLLQKLKLELYDAAKLYLHGTPTIAPTVEDPDTHEVLLLYHDDTQVRVQVSADATVSQLRQADDALQGVDEGAWVDAATSKALNDADVVRGRTIRVCPAVAGVSSDACHVDLGQLERDLPLVPAAHPLSVDTPPEETLVRDDAHESVSVKRHCTVDVRAPVDDLVGLLPLSGVQLASLVPPLVVSVDQCAALRQAHTSSAARLQLLQKQEAAMGDDELNLHVLSCVQLSGRADVRYLDPVLATGWLRSGTVDQVRSWMALSPNVTCVVTAVLLEEHWIPIMWNRGLSEVRVTMWEHDDASVEPLCVLHGLISQAWERPMFALACNRRSFARDHCGAAAVCFLGHVLLNKPLPVDEAALHQVHADLQQSFCEAIGCLTEVPKPWCWGLGVPDVLGLVSNLLQLHGVPHAQCSIRAKMVIQSLGKSDVQTAVTGITPWKSLKALANLHHPVIQLVLPDEQAKYAAARQSPAQHAPKKSAGGTKRLPPARPAELDPAKLVIETGSFCVDSDAPLAQTPFSTLGPLSVGVALATYQDALPFLEAGQVLSHGGLALLVLNPPNELVTSLQWSTLRFAARCTYNQEPMLLSGVLVQLGKKMVYQYQAKDVPAIMSVDVACARITVYVDQWEHSWEEFASKPVKHVLSCIPCLQTCRIPDCQCPGWHPPSADHHDALLDVFRRQFFGDNGRPTKWDKATYFAVLIRYVKGLESSVLSASGRCGLYIEPKTEDAMQPHSDYQVIWVPSLDFAAVAHKAKCEAHCLGIARAGKRFGLRVLAQHFPEVFASVKPDAVYLAPGSRLTFHTGPWPYGCDRKSIAKALRAVGWECRPLQPLHNVAGGLVWSVQANGEPPRNVLSMQHGQVVLTRHDPKQTHPDQPAVRLCSVPASSDQDPWLTHDPWKKAVASVPAPAAPQPTVNALQELEARVERSILAKLPAPSESMEIDDQDQCLQVLEQQVQQLAGRQAKLEVTVSDNHAQQTAQVHTLQQQMMMQMDLQSNKMQAMLSDQMSRLETILSKKSRTEWRSGSPTKLPSRGVIPWFCQTFRVFFLTVLFMVTCRIGEAGNPGPATDQPSWDLQSLWIAGKIPSAEWCLRWCFGHFRVTPHQAIHT